MTSVSLSGWRLAWRLALRELRGGLSGFRVFLASLTLGVAAIAAVASVNEAVSKALTADARVLFGGDLDVRLVQRTPTAADIWPMAGSSAPEMSQTVRTAGATRTAVRPAARPSRSFFRQRLS